MISTAFCTLAAVRHRGSRQKILSTQRNQRVTKKQMTPNEKNQKAPKDQNQMAPKDQTQMAPKDQFHNKMVLQYQKKVR